MRRLIGAVIVLGILGLAAFWVLTAPRMRDTAADAALTPDQAHGALVFWASGCASCHMAAKATGAAELVLSGGQRFATAFGTFLAPNISPDKIAGIGAWSLDDFIHAVQDGVRPDGSHEFPAMPYVAYSKMAPQDVVDLKAFMDTLPATATPSLPHEVSFPFNIRRSLGGWKLLFFAPAYVLQGTLTPEQTRGRYIAEAMAHCGECHTPRNPLGGLSTGSWLAGAPLPDGKGKTPNITPGKLAWSDADVFAFLTTGFTPSFNSASGPMADVVTNMARLPPADVQAIVAYLRAVPAIK